MYESTFPLFVGLAATAAALSLSYTGFTDNRCQRSSIRVVFVMFCDFAGHFLDLSLQLKRLANVYGRAERHQIHRKVLVHRRNVQQKPCLAIRPFRQIMA
ncbi:hypothetical protein D3C75_1064330 [compost metagenome]